MALMVVVLEMGTEMVTVTELVNTVYERVCEDSLEAGAISLQGNSQGSTESDLVK